jgi:hypothetical protein
MYFFFLGYVENVLNRSYRLSEGKKKPITSYGHVLYAYSLFRTSCEVAAAVDPSRTKMKF